MKTRINLHSLLIVLLFTGSADLACGQSTLLLQHSGYTDPTTEGFGFSGVSDGAAVGPVTNDLGMNAWSIIASPQWIPDYGQDLTSQETSLVMANDWVLSVTIRLVNVGINGSEGGVFFYTGSEEFEMGIYSLSGNEQVAVQSTTYAYDLTSASGYNNFQLVYNAANGTANLWVNGTEEISDIPPETGGTPGSGGLSWDTTTGQANWNLVSLEVAPEPSSTALLVLGGGALIYVCKRKRPGPQSAANCRRA